MRDAGRRYPELIAAHSAPLSPVPRPASPVPTSLAPPNAHATIRGDGPNEWPSVAQLRRDSTRQPASHLNREIDLETTVHGARLEIGGVVIRDAQFDPAVRGLHVETGAVPAPPDQLDVDSAVGRLAVHVSTDRPE